MIKGSTLSRLLYVGLVVGAMSHAAVAQDATAPAAEAQQTQEAQQEVPESITLTLPDGSKSTLSPGTIIRIRKAVPPETKNGAKTRIDWLQLLLVRESPEEVGELVEEIVPSIAKLRMPEGSPIWFNARAAQGPMPLTPDQMKNGVRSAIILGNSMQFLGSTPEEVRQVLNEKGGTALPEPQAVASLSPQGVKTRLAQKALQEQQQAAAAAQAAQQEQQAAQAQPVQAPQPQVVAAVPPIQTPQEVAVQIGEIIRLQQQARAEPAPQVAQPQSAQPQVAQPQVAQPQVAQLEPEVAAPVGEIIRLQVARAEPAPQFVQPQPEVAQQVQAPVGEIIRLQVARAEPAPQPVQAQPVQPQVAQLEQAPAGEIIRLQQAPTQAQSEPAGQIIRLQQTQVALAPQLPQPQPTQVALAPQAQDEDDEPMEQLIRLQHGQRLLEVLDGFSELTDGSPKAQPAAKRRTSSVQPGAKQGPRPSRGL